VRLRNKLKGDNEDRIAEGAAGAGAGGVKVVTRENVVWGEGVFGAKTA
jgi:hypothetical protein